MKQYPSILTKIDENLSIYAFDKIDGTNIRAEFSKKKGFYKFGTRRMLIDEGHEDFGEAIIALHEKYEDDLIRIIERKGWDSVVCFFEWAGPNSFAGSHENSDTKDLFLFDVNVHKKGFLSPQDFLKYFGDTNISQLLYQGRADKSFVESVKHSFLEDMTFEGVVCKAKKKNKAVMFKVKSLAWLDKLKNKCGDNEQLFKSLA